MLRNAASLSTYPTSTWAGLPAAASAQGQIVRVTDFGVAGVGLLFISDGVRWLPLGVQELARFGDAQAAVTGSLAEVTCWTVNVPANMLGLSGGLRIRDKRSRTNNANAHTLRIRWGGLAGDVVAITSASGVGAVQLDAEIRNRNSAAVQILSGAGGGYLSSAAAWVTSNKDTTAAVSLVGTVQLATSTADTVTPESLTVELLP